MYIERNSKTNHIMYRNNKKIQKTINKKIIITDIKKFLNPKKYKTKKKT